MLSKKKNNTKKERKHKGNFTENSLSTRRSNCNGEKLKIPNKLTKNYGGCIK